MRGYITAHGEFFGSRIPDVSAVGEASTWSSSSSRARGASAFWRRGVSQEYTTCGTAMTLEPLPGSAGDFDRCHPRKFYFAADDEEFDRRDR